MSIKYKTKQINEAVRLFFDENMSQRQACEIAGIATATLARELYDHHLCYHPACTNLHPCRASKRGTNGVMFCGALTETNTVEFCPFFKTQTDFDQEYQDSNRMTDKQLKSMGYTGKE